MRPPKVVKPYVISFCRSIVADPSPVYIPVRPIKGSPPNECFTVVPKHVSVYGGEQSFGWTIWEWPKVFIEAEFHCVWRDPNGALLDVTKKSIEIPRILFLPDPSRRYSGRQVNNRRKPLCHDPDVKRFIELSDLYHQAINEGDLADYYGQIELSERASLNEIEREQVQQRLIRRYGANRPEIFRT